MAARETALGTVAVRVGPAWHGRVDAFIPLANWGIRVAAFSGPVELHVSYGSSVHRTIAGYPTLLNTGANVALVATEAPAVLVSTSTATRSCCGPLRRLFAGRPVFFAGDFGQRGTEADADALVPRVIRL